MERLPAYRAGRSVAGASKLSSNELPWAPPPAVLAAVALPVPNRYPDAGATALRHAIAANRGVDPPAVAVGAGAVGLLQQLALAFVAPGAEVVRGEPSFEAYPIFTRLVGGVDVAVPAAGAHLDLPAMAAAVTPRTAMVLVADPNNPTGTAASRAAVEALVDAVPPGCLVVLDGAYQEFTDDPDDDVAMDLARSRANVVALRTFSKAHGLAGLRVGYAVGHPDVVAALDKVRIPFVVGSAAQEAAIASLAAIDEVMAGVAAINGERERVTAALRALGADVPASATNFVWLACGAAALPVAAGLEVAGIVVRPFDGVGVRVSVGTPADNDRFLAAIAGMLRA